MKTGSNNMNICQKYILNEGVCNTGDGLPGSALVMIAVGVTVGVVLGLTLFAFQTKWDFTGAAPYMMVALLCLLMFGLIGGIWLRRYWTFNIIYAILGTLLFSFYLVFDTQLIIGGKHRKYQCVASRGRAGGGGGEGRPALTRGPHTGTAWTISSSPRSRSTWTS